MVLAGTCLWGRRWRSALLAVGPGKAKKDSNVITRTTQRSRSDPHLVCLLLTESKQK